MTMTAPTGQSVITPADPMAGPALAREAVTTSFGSFVAMQDFGIDFRTSAVDGIIGPNGAGETTLFNLLTGLGYRHNLLENGCIVRTMSNAEAMPDEDR